ncbi:cell division protein ZapB [Allochromatium warmingii]|uniref:Cell division protein ZapB n=1 Tax=Allochromatium warmingii TaxID=61595 RepID=A0A1H3GFN0_ALLWA|nr:cell division protein ZapB [Allochromatium warmingii]
MESRILANLDLDQFELQLNALICLNEQLKEENAALRARQELLTAERHELIEKTEHARRRIEAMLSRLRAMEEYL